MFSTNAIAEYLNIAYQGPEYFFKRVCTDSREVHSGDLFIALVGEKFDGHEFIQSVIAKGALGVVISKDMPLDAKVAKFLVKDTLSAYQQLARAHRRSMRNLKVIGITGSTGKTSTKDILSCCLAKKYHVVKNHANFNNEIGLPKTVLEIQDDTEIAVVEMGMRGLGQIRQLSSIARPDSAIITNVGVTHIELLGSQENIALAKSEILESINANGYAVLNGDDEYTLKMGEKCQGQVFYFGIKDTNDYYATDIRMSTSGTDFMCTEKLTGKRVNVHIPLLGLHNVYNTLAALAMSVCCGMDVAEAARAVREVTLSEHRLEIVEQQGITFIDDSYNASPTSMKAALDTLLMVKNGCDRSLRCRSIAVLADMLELGELSKEEHIKIGEYCQKTKVDYVFAFGEKAVDIYQKAKQLGLKAQYAHTIREITKSLSHVLRPGDVVLLKGSHSMQVNKVMELLNE